MFWAAPCHLGFGLQSRVPVRSAGSTMGKNGPSEVLDSAGLSMLNLHPNHMSSRIFIYPYVSVQLYQRFDCVGHLSQTRMGVAR